MTATYTHKLTVTNIKTGEATVSRHDFNGYKEQAPKVWKTYAKAVLDVLIEKLDPKIFECKIELVDTNKG